MAQLEQILLSPLITEKSSLKSDKENRYGFKVDLKANKNQIKMAVEKLYDVKVLNIKTNILPGKLKRVGRTVTRTSKSKKAFVQLEQGQKIEFFKGI